MTFVDAKKLLNDEADAVSRTENDHKQWFQDLYCSFK
jgi:hypothetical protein